MKTFQKNKPSLRQKIHRATGSDLGVIHPAYLQTPDAGGMYTYRVKHAATGRPTHHLAVHYLPSHPTPATHSLTFNLN